MIVKRRKATFREPPPVAAECADTGGGSRFKSLIHQGLQVTEKFAKAEKLAKKYPENPRFQSLIHQGLQVITNSPGGWVNKR
jgi:hypothetical protein